MYPSVVSLLVICCLCFHCPYVVSRTRTFVDRDQEGGVGAESDAVNVFPVLIWECNSLVAMWENEKVDSMSNQVSISRPAFMVSMCPKYILDQIKDCKSVANRTQDRVSIGCKDEVALLVDCATQV